MHFEQRKRWRTALAVGAWGAILGLYGCTATPTPETKPAGAVYTRSDFAALPGWRLDRHAADQRPTELPRRGLHRCGRQRQYRQHPQP